MNNNFDQLLALIKQDLDYVTQLEELLAQEKQVLTDREFLKLSDIASQKQKIIYTIEENNRQKLAILEPIVGNTKPEDLQALMVSKFGEDQANQLHNSNEELKTRLASCHKKNAVNGQVIIRNLENNKDLLSLITGQTRQGEIYNALGNVENGFTPNLKEGKEV